MRALIVTAVAAERDAVVRGLGRAAAEAVAPTEVALPGGVLHRLEWSGAPALTVDVTAAGVGPAAAAAGSATALTAAALAHAPYDLAVSAGIGGGFTGPAGAQAAPRAPLGSVVIADAVVAADLGAETADGFAAVTDLGFGTVEHLPPAALVAAAAEAVHAVRGTVLTVSTVTGSAERTAELLRRHPRAAAEAMEGFGVAEAAAAQSVPVLEVRAISNAVGPRDRAAWRIGEALEALAVAFGNLVPVLRTWTLEPGAGPDFVDREGIRQ
ncbi:futalosine hydrolase [Streptomyces coffeae]|uniref:Futalosine hydrolase n=1 Tax=Streptomyces coffeae TaxID=621382 RepID=A0ABS1N5K1_9ACTN|nr:futalosine hydrolase [Streptomyces coffeae]MBL1095352.1 futalosine hydrolase [Streptomyces coffeae]